MNKKILTLIIAVVIIAVILVISFFKFNPEKKEINEPVSQENKEAEPADLDESIKSAIEDLESVCADFLKGDLSGNPNFDCPEFDKPINQDLCFYCYAVKNQRAELCESIINEPGFKIICQRATGASIEEIISQ